MKSMNEGIVHSKDKPPDMVEAYRLHSEEDFEALKRIVENGVRRRETAESILDLFQELTEGYREIALRLAPIEKFPGRKEKWPALFTE